MNEWQPWRTPTVERTGGPERVVTDKPLGENETLPLPVGLTQIAQALKEKK